MPQFDNSIMQKRENFQVSNKSESMPEFEVGAINQAEYTKNTVRGIGKEKLLRIPLARMTRVSYLEQTTFCHTK